ncbi:hypothetical protein BC941DRAFT_417031 [Chlamydoabsidia padenii]|nr:hypothetical protein BC941DRAFT_417031 [Chlamydoabsidia padenii]
MVLKRLLWTSILIMINPYNLVEASVRVMSTNRTLLSQTSNFGPRIGAYGILGHVYEPLDDATGCQLVQTYDAQWIALVKRGGCSFLHKVQSMQQSGAIAVIVGDENSTEWITMSSEDDTSGVNIPSVFLSQNEYHQLIYAQQQRQPLLVLLEDADIMSRSNTAMDYFYIMIPLCPALLLILYWVFIQQRKQYKASLYLYYEQQRSSSTQHHTLNEIDLELCLPKQHTSDAKDKTDSVECAICLNSFDEGSEYRRLVCRHIFHTTCIDPWLTNYKSSCPMCSQQTIQ